MFLPDLLKAPLQMSCDVRAEVDRKVFGPRERPVAGNEHPLGSLGFEPDENVLCMVCTSASNMPTAREVLESTVRIAHLQGAKVWVQFFDNHCLGDILDSTSALALERFDGNGGTDPSSTWKQTVSRLPLPNGGLPDHVVWAFQGNFSPFKPHDVDDRVLPTTLLLPPSLGNYCLKDTAAWNALGVATPRITHGWLDQIESEVQAIHDRYDAGRSHVSLEASTFMTACRAGDLATINADWNPSLAQTVEHGQSALMVAVLHGHVDVVNRLLPYSDMRHQDFQGKTALMHAAMLFHPRMIDILLPVSDTLQQDHQGRNALMWGLLHDTLGENNKDSCWSTLKTLAGASDPQQADLEGNSSLMWALRLEHPSSLIESLVPGSNLDQQNERGDTPLMIALKRDSWDLKSISAPTWKLVPTLMSVNNLTLQNNDGDTPLLQALILTTCPHEVLTSLLERSDVEQQNKHGHTPLMLASCQSKNLAVLKALLPRSNLHQMDKDGRTALDFAVTYGNREAERLLEPLVLQDVAATNLELRRFRPRL